VTFEVEVVVRTTGQVVQESLYLDGPAPAHWTDADVRAVLISMLLAVDRAVTGEAGGTRSVVLRGLSWIVTAFDEGSAIAIEIPSGSVVGGPFDIAESALTPRVARVIAQHAAPPA